MLSLIGRQGMNTPSDWSTDSTQGIMVMPVDG